MNKLNLNFLFALTFVFIAISCGPQRTGIVDVKFTKELKQADLDKIQLDLKSQDIDLNYDLLEFDDKGFLKRINASIDYKDGTRDSFKSRELKPSDKPGFYRNFSED